jgi:hypothetical protein
MALNRIALSTVLMAVLLVSQFAPFGNNETVYAADLGSEAAAAPGVSFDFTSQICAARWQSGVGTLNCPFSDGDARGFALSVASPKLENGTTDGAPGLLVSPQNKYDGYIQGFFPEYTVQTGDHFQASVGCAYGSACYVTYRLDYQINNGAIHILWSWKEKNEGQIYQLDKDLSALAGQKVRFILTLLATGSATNDRAIWGQPRIVSSGTGTPVTPNPTSIPPQPTLPPASGAILDFAGSACSASWRSGVGVLPCPGADGDIRGFALPVSNPTLENGLTNGANALILVPQNKYDGYIQGTYPEITVQRGDHFQGIVGCAYGSSCYVTFRLDYVTETGLQVKYWTWAERNEGRTYFMDKDLSALAGRKVRFVLMLLATGSASNDRAVWSQPRIVRTNTVPPTPTSTPVPQGAVTNVNAGANIPPAVNCAGTMTVELVGSITTNGPATVRYHWEISGTVNNTTAESTLTFASAGTQSATVNYPLNCGSYTARLVVTHPNAITSQTDFSLSVPTLLPIYDFNTFGVIGTMACTGIANYAWRQEACNGESGGCWISQTPLFGNNYAGFFRHDGNTICGLQLP